MTALAFGVFGLIVGSFLNVVILRHGVRSVAGRSGCMSCGTQLPWYDMIPFFSWLALRGRCRSCRARISIQYPLVEAATAVSFGFIGASSLPVPSQIIGCVILALLICIAAYDILHTIIPDEWVWSFNALALFLVLAFPLQATSYQLQALLAGPAAASPLFALWLFSRGRWMGLGDAKLALGIGWLLGPALGIFAIFGAFVIGAIVSLLLVFFSSEQWKKIIQGFTPTPISQRLVWGFTMKSEIPFGPFLIAACLIVWFATMYDVQVPLLSMYEV